MANNLISIFRADASDLWRTKKIIFIILFRISVFKEKSLNNNQVTLSIGTLNVIFRMLWFNIKFQWIRCNLYLFTCNINYSNATAMNDYSNDIIISENKVMNNLFQVFLRLLPHSVLHRQLHGCSSQMPQLRRLPRTIPTIKISSIARIQPSRLWLIWWLMIFTYYDLHQQSTNL